MANEAFEERRRGRVDHGDILYLTYTATLPPTTIGAHRRQCWDRL